MDLSISSLFVEGLLSFFSPCILPLFPLYIGYLTAEIREKDENGNTTYPRVRTFILTLGFSLGICTLFFLLGLGSNAVNLFLREHQIGLSIAGGVILLFMSLVILGIIEIPLLNRMSVQVKLDGKSMNFFKAWLSGALVSLTWAPCIGPMLSQAILMASQTGGIRGWSYILAYALGLILMFLLAGLFTNEILAFVKKIKPIAKYTKIISGVLIMGMGIYMLYQGHITIQALENTTGQTQGAETAITEGETQRAIEQYDFTLAEADGTEHSLTDYEGKVIVLNFFETWCQYCNQELPHLEKIANEMDNVEILLINAPHVRGEGDVEYVEKYLRDKGYTHTVLYDVNQDLIRRFGITGWPYSFIMRPDGEWYGYIPGYVDEATMRSILEEAAKPSDSAQ